MWIRSQDKKILTEIHDLEVDSGFKVWGSGMLIGEYSTEEKAMRVMDMIQKQIASRSESYELVRPILKSNRFSPYWKKREVVFNMPEDTEIWGMFKRERRK